MADYQFTNTPLYVSEGDYVQFRFQAPDAWETSITIQVRVGLLDTFWYIETLPEDLTPKAFPFQKVEDAEFSTMYTYGDGNRPAEAIVLVEELTDSSVAAVAVSSNYPVPTGEDPTNYYGARIDYNGDGTWDTGWFAGTAPQGVENGALIQIRGFSQPAINSTTLVTLVIGTANETWQIKTQAAAQNIPEPFPDWQDIDDREASQMVYSEPLRIDGLIPNSVATLLLTNSSAEWARSNTNTTFTNGDGYEVLSGVTWNAGSGDVVNGDWVQLRVTSSSAAFGSITTNVTIGDGVNGDTWTVTTGEFPDTEPSPFQFENIDDALTDTLYGSKDAPEAGIAGIDPEVVIPVTLDATGTSATEYYVRVTKADGTVGSLGSFPTTVALGDKLALFARSAPNYGGQIRTVKINVGGIPITTWQVKTGSGPDPVADFQPPQNLVNQYPNQFVTSAPFTISGINVPITIESTGGYNALISIDGDEAVTGPRTFDPATDTAVTLTIKTSDQLDTPETTTISVGSGSGDNNNNPFVWQARTYVTLPTPPSNVGTWYSIKSYKQDGYPLGTVIPIMKQGDASYGDLDGDLIPDGWSRTGGALSNIENRVPSDVQSRYPGFIECDGRELNAAAYRGLYEVIGTHYGGAVVVTAQDLLDDEGQVVGTYNEYSGNFRIPDYRNRKLCGTGIVDSSRGSSAFLPISSSGGGIDIVGSEGGYWYFDKVDTLGTQPLEQIEGTGDNGLESAFFSLGTVRINGLETVTGEVQYSINGSVTATIGPLSSVIVQVPEHDHLYFSAVTDAEEGEAVIPWGGGGSGGRAGFQFSEVQAYPYGITGSDPKDSDSIWDTWEKIIQSDWTAIYNNLKEYYGNDFDLRDWVESNLPAGQNVNAEYAQIQGASLGLGPGDQDDEGFTEQFTTWWLSDINGLSGAVLQNAAGQNSQQTAGVIDTRPSTFRISSYTPASGSVRTHSHLITEYVVGDPNTDFSGGNLGGVGDPNTPYGAGGLSNSGTTGGVLAFQMYERRSADGPYDEMQLVNKTINEWTYRIAGQSYWTEPGEEITVEEELRYRSGYSGDGEGFVINYTMQAYPSLTGDNLFGDTRIRVNQIINAGSGFQPGDELTAPTWADTPGLGSEFFMVVSNVSTGGVGGVGENIPIIFTQNELFMDMTEGTFKLSSSIKKPVPDVTMKPQRQVPIISPFHKTKYMIKAY